MQAQKALSGQQKLYVGQQNRCESGGQLPVQTRVAWAGTLRLAAAATARTKVSSTSFLRMIESSSSTVGCSAKRGCRAHFLIQ
jgi:hypothetical protein